MLPLFAYVRPGSVEQAAEQLARPGARAAAGGTDLLGCVRDQAMKVETVVALGRLEALRGVVSTSDGGLRIGALTTIADVAAHPAINERYTALAEAAAAVASPQIRNQGTLGGNICQRPRCWYFRGGYDCARKGGETCYAMSGDNRYHAIFGGSGCYIVHPSDTAPALVALGASVGIAGRSGSRLVPAESFFVGPDTDLTRETDLQPGELVTEIVLPAPIPALKSTYRKVRTRGAWDFALAGLALAIARANGKVTHARAVLSGVAPVPWRLAKVEQVIVGQRLDVKAIASAADAAVAGAQPLELNGYKLPLVRGVVEEVLARFA